jgi:hypothetical protein
MGIYMMKIYLQSEYRRRWRRGDNDVIDIQDVVAHAKFTMNNDQYACRVIV